MTPYPRGLNARAPDVVKGASVRNGEAHEAVPARA